MWADPRISSMELYASVWYNNHGLWASHVNKSNASFGSVYDFKTCATWCEVSSPCCINMWETLRELVETDPNIEVVMSDPLFV